MAWLLRDLGRWAWSGLGQPLLLSTTASVAAHEPGHPQHRERTGERAGGEHVLKHRQLPSTGCQLAPPSNER
jgi:hypothetical protein